MLHLGQVIQEVDASRRAEFDRADEVVDPRDDVLQRESLFGFELGDVCESRERSVVWTGKKKERRTRVGSLKRLVHHAVHDLVDVGGMRITRAVVHGSLVRNLVSGVAGLLAVAVQRAGSNGGER